MTYNISCSKMKKVNAIILCSLLSIGELAGQDKLPEFNSIRTPNSPAFSVLGIQPTSIERPNTPADLAVSIDNATGGFTSFPQNYSIEFSPYWMGGKASKLSWKKDTVRRVEESFLRTFSMSFATTNKEYGEKNVRGLSYGLRAFLLSGKVSRKSVAQIEALEGELIGYSKKYSEMNAELESEFQRKMEGAKTAEEMKSVQNWFNDKKKKQIAERVEENAEAMEMNTQRKGLIVEIAYAGAYKNDTINTELSKSGYAFWLTPAYVQDDYSLVGVYRYLKDSLDNKSEEYGFRFIYTKSRYAISVEYLKGHYKTETTLPDRERLSVLFEYLLGKDLWLSLSFGDDNKNAGGESNVFSSFGIKYNISGRRYSF
jgi:hypothetical protein